MDVFKINDDDDDDDEMNSLKWSDIWRKDIIRAADPIIFLTS